MPRDCCVRMLLKMLQPEHREEPVFLLRAQDITAPGAVRDWIRRARAAGAPEAKLAKSQEHLDALVQWQLEHPDRVKVPD